MRIIADLQIHSKYSRACSQDLVPGNIAVWAAKKGIGLMGTGDFTHPAWNRELKDALEPAEPGLFRLKSGASQVLFMLTAEVSSIYKQGDRVRRVHNMILAPDFAAVDRIIAALELLGCNLKADGRPIIGVHCDVLAKLVLEADARAVIFPAHVWTPHFGLFGSLSGFDSVEEAFGDYAKHVFALETGLSSDPRMNWQISAHDKYSLLSSSDAHSLRKIGREANVFDVAPSRLSYDEVIRVIRDRNPKEFLYTIEFFPEEGKYHLDGHADCKFSCLPAQTRQLKGICPVCGKRLLVGVLNRINELGDREYGHQPKGAVPFRNAIPLEEIIADVFQVGTGSKRVQATYEQMVAARPEFEIILDMPEQEIAAISSPLIANAVTRVRAGRVHVAGGYDGIFGKIHIYTDEERQKMTRTSNQIDLF